MTTMAGKSFCDALLTLNVVSFQRYEDKITLNMPA